MRILFVCGSIEPGHDGIGDYTRELAGALNIQGVETQILALADRSVDRVLNEIQTSNNSPVQVLRLSKSLAARTRKAEYQKTVENFKPDWISLQYVPYAFSAKGIPINLAGLLNVKNTAVKWHFMVHESYIGGELGLKDKLIQRLQISGLKGLVNRLSPTVINTTTALYKGYLEKIEIESEILGLFGNIPIAQESEQFISDGILRGIYFGSAPDEQYFQKIADAIHSYINSEKVKMEIILCGKSGDKGKRFAKAIRGNFDPNGLQVTEKGPLSTIELSKLFLRADFGIARVAPRLLGKSGSVMSMLEHGLLLWVPLSSSKSEIPSNFDFRVEQCFSNLDDFKKVKSSFKPQSRLEEIAGKFLESLTRNDKTA